MLPFLKQDRKQTGVMIQERKSDSPEPKAEISEGLEAAAQDLHSALKSGDIKSIASAIRAAYEIIQSEGSEDQDSESMGDFDSQNMLAAKEDR